MKDVFCPTCGAAADAVDNFCRRCGAAVNTTRLPAVRQDATPTVWQPAVSPVMKGAAVMAAGTVGQMLVRQAVRRILGGGNPRRRGIQLRRPQERDGLVDDAQIVTEMMMVRRVRMRRQPD